MIELVLVLLLFCAIVAVTVRPLITAIVVLSLFSILSSLLFVLWNAPDVALTEAAVGTGIGSVVFVWIAHVTSGGRRARR